MGGDNAANDEHMNGGKEMYALTKNSRVAFVVNWSRNKSAEDITRYLAYMRDCPYEWDVKADTGCGAISIVIRSHGEYPAVAQQGKAIHIYKNGSWDNYYDGVDNGDIAYVPEPRHVGVILDTEDLDDLRYLADRGHTVTVRPDGVIVDREHYSSYILRDSDGCLSDLPYGDPHDYAFAEGLTCELVPME